MASTTLAEISRQDLLELTTLPLASITDVRHLSSYNWIEANSPTIAVPGSPPLWAALQGPRTLKKDSGLIYIAQNAARHPDSPLEPLFRALYIANPSFDIGSIDVVTDRNNIRKLLSFINPGSARNGLEPFTINIEVVKNTAIFSRTETATHEFVGVHEFKGFGHEFEKSYTTSQISDKKGQVIPLGSTLEIKTRVVHKPLEIQEITPQLWISQTPKLVRAYHRKGTFQQPKVEDVAAQVKRWEESNQTDLRKLAALINKILVVVKGCDKMAMVKYDVKKDKLVIWKIEGKKMLPKDLYSKWDKRDDSEAETITEHNAGAESAVKPAGGVETKAEGKLIVHGPGETKGKEAAAAVKEGEQTLPEELFPNPTLAKDTDSGSRDKVGERLAAELGEASLSTH
ncbi:MAG: hypothetical protein L6R42_007709 [Xanthoria sp. 1 TBL-2021]|nr:MAG: hypothetical protein L6R42_007709 [Xanthoria sp. 1 TBL-2021]